MDELTAAGITAPLLRESYAECKRLNSLHGKTYFLATLLLPKEKRPFVHALYGFARYADEIVDDLASELSLHEKEEALTSWGQGVLSSLDSGVSNDPVGRALVDTVQRFDIPHEYFVAFLHSMKMDLHISTYKTYENLMEYVYGSAAVIGLEMVPVLGALSNEAYEPAKTLGIAFQLANFIRDVGEDLDRGRIYLPLDELAACGVDEEMLLARKLTPEIIVALKEQISRVRDLQTQAEPGIAFLDPTSRPCIRAASNLYCGIVDEVEAIDYDVFNRRATTSISRRLRVASIAYAQALIARQRRP